MKLDRWTLEVLAAEEPTPAEAEAVARRVAVDPQAQRQLDELARSNAEILARYPPKEVAAAIERRLHQIKTRDAVAETQRQRDRGWTARIAWATPLLAGAALLFVALLPTDQGSGPEQIFLKSPPKLVAFRDRGGEQQQLVAGEARARAGDRIQLGYVAPRGGWGLIVSLDGHGQVTRHWPEHGPAGRLEVATMTLLDHSYELDDAPRFERFFLIIGSERFDGGAVEGSIRALSIDPVATPALPPDLMHVELVVAKP